MTEKRHLDFVFLCEKKFEELDGEDRVIRRCGSCDTDVYDLDAFDDAARDAFLLAADDAGMELCARLTVRAEAPSCAKHMKPGTYTGRTQASTRRLYTRRETSLMEKVARGDRARAEVARLVEEVRRKPR